MVTPGPPVQGGQKSRPNRCGSGGGLRRPHCKLQDNAQLAPRRTSLLPYGTTRVELVKVFVGRTLASTTPHALTARVSRTNEVTPRDVTGVLESTLCRTEFRLELFPFWFGYARGRSLGGPLRGHTEFSRARRVPLRLDSRLVGRQPHASQVEAAEAVGVGDDVDFDDLAVSEPPERHHAAGGRAVDRRMGGLTVD